MNPWTRLLYCTSTRFDGTFSGTAAACAFAASATARLRHQKLGFDSLTASSLTSPERCDPSGEPGVAEVAGMHDGVGFRV